jgi:hypothetical protein
VIGSFTIGHAADYDLCYTGRSAGDRVRIAQALLTTTGQQGHSLEKDACKPKFGPLVVWGLRERREFGDFQAPAAEVTA